MFKYSQTNVTPSKLLNGPAGAMKKDSKVPIKNILALPSKFPKLYSSFKTSVLPGRPLSQKCEGNSNLPPFLNEYLNEVFKYSRLKTKRKLVNCDYEKKETSPKPVSEEKREKKQTSFENFFQAFKQKPKSMNTTHRPLYKPYFIEISPRAKIKLYSQEPFAHSMRNTDFKKSKKKKPKNQSYDNIDSRKIPECKAKRIYISEYTKSYAEKLKKVIEISEEARLEANMHFKSAI